MRTRNILLKVRVSEEEAENLKACAGQYGLTQSALMRLLIKGQHPKPAPPESFWMMLDELYSICNSFKEIAEADRSESADAGERQKQTADFILQIQATVTLPERVRYGDNQDMGG